MRKFRLQSAALLVFTAGALSFAPVAFQTPAYCQETTGGLQGTIKDPSGAVVPKAKLVLTSTSLMGSKELVTDSSGYYRFANLPPGTYTLEVVAQGFKTEKREGINVGVGRLPSLDLALQIGAESATVEVSTDAPVIDTTTTENMTNVTSEALQLLPTGTTFQSVIQFAPMARNEPLAGLSVRGTGSGGTGGSMPGSSGNGQGFGYSIGGAADSESSYLVEGQDTENISGGYSKANVPMEFIQEVQMKTSGVAAEYGGALGGVVNVIMKKGSNDFHGQFFSSYESDGLDANPINAYLRYDPNDPGNAAARQDRSVQLYQAKKDHFRTMEPGFTVGGPIKKDRLWFFAGFEPLINTRARTVDFSNSQALPDNAGLGLQYFTQDRSTYFGSARIDAALTSKIRVFGSWLYQYARETGDSMPTGDPIKPEAGYLNTSINSPISNYFHGLGWSAPNSTYNVGADLTLTQKLVATTRYGYFFENYHDFGWPTTVPDLVWNNDGTGLTDAGGTNPLPSSLQLPGGFSTTPYNSTFTVFNASKHYQFNQDLAFFKGGWAGTHNFKFGYQLNHLVNVISQNGNVPQAFVNPGFGNTYGAATQTGIANCDALTAVWGGCTGQYGYLYVQDFATVLTTPASDYNHALYVQDSWQIGKGITIDAGLRIEREHLPAPGGIKVSAIDFPWSDKIEPRLGAAWDPTRKGTMKIFGSYGVVNDVMKLLLAQTSWGAQAYEQCVYALGPNAAGSAGTFNPGDIDLVFKAGRACPNGPATTGANFANGQVPASLTDAQSGVSLIENVPYRPWEPVAPGVKPYRQHEYVAGVDYEIRRGFDFEARYDRRRLDHVIEDASLADPAFFELYTIVNPGEGVNRTIDGYANYLTSIGEAYGTPGTAFNSVAPFGTCPSCPANPKAVRNYDGLEFRLTMTGRRGLSGMFSYTYSSLWGNYTGLTTTDQSDGGSTGRNSPDTTRSFDEPFYYFGANGKSNNGALPTDRPNVLKGYVYYTLPSWKHQLTNIGLVQYGYQGTPLGSYADLALGSTGGTIEATYLYGRDKWVDMSTDSNGNITLSNPYTKRTPWYTQSDLNLSHQIKTGDHQSITFEATALNALNQRSVTSYNMSLNTWAFRKPLYPGLDSAGHRVNFGDGAELYQILEGGYDPSLWINGNGGQVPSVVADSQYKQPYLFQNGRSLRLAVRFTF
jgi:hypothetical protein